MEGFLFFFSSHLTFIDPFSPFFPPPSWEKREDSGPVFVDHVASSAQELISELLEEMVKKEYFPEKVREEMMNNLFTHSESPGFARSIYHSTAEKSGV